MNGRDGRSAGADWLFDGVGEPSEPERELVEALRAARWGGGVEEVVGRIEDVACELGWQGETRTPGLEDSAGLSPGEGEAHLPPASRTRPTPSVLRRGTRRKGTGRRGTGWWLGGAILAAAAVLIGVNLWAFVLRAEPDWRRAAGGGWAVGSWLETGAGESVEVASRIGRVTVGPGSRVRLARASKDEHRLELAEGSIEALIFAPPKLFFVETPAATAVDMGCAYKLDVARDGSGMLRVTGGWVELQAELLASRVPAGAVCTIGAGGELGVPRFEDASPEFASAVDRLVAGDAPALETLLELARPRDGLTLWHLLARTGGGDRARVAERLAEIVPPPSDDLTRRAIDLDPESLDTWWRAVRRAW